MENKSYMYIKFISALKSMALVALSVSLLTACASTTQNDEFSNAPIATPSVDYVEVLDVYSAPHQDSFLNQLAMNYRSYAVYNARTSGYPDIGEIFAQKAIVAFSGETPYPETTENWTIADKDLGFELHNSLNELINELKNDVSDTNPDLAAEAQAKFDCWLSASASGQMETARECKGRFDKAMIAIQGGTGTVVGGRHLSMTDVRQETKVTRGTRVKETFKPSYYPETRKMTAMRNAAQAREGVIVVNNVNIPDYLINPVPVQPIVFNQNIYSGDKKGVICENDEQGCFDEPRQAMYVEEEIPMMTEELVTREDFINMMMALRSELVTINAKLDRIQASAGEKTILKVQQIPLEPKQHVMEEIFEIRFDFDKSSIKPEYEDLIRKLATATQNNKNIKVSVIGHTDTSGSTGYNYALGGRRAEAVQKTLVKYGIPSGQIVAVSSGEKDNKVPTGDGVPNADNRRVRVVKEVHYTEQPKHQPEMMIQVQPGQAGGCGMYGC